MLFLFCFFILILFSCSTFKYYDQLLQDIITPWGIFLFDCAIYKKCLWSEKSNLKLFSLEKYNIKQNIFWKLWSLHWVRGTPGNWVVKKCPSTVFVGGGECGIRESLQYHKNGLIFPCSLNGFSRKCWVCSFHAVFSHISQNVCTRPLPSLAVYTKWEILDLELILTS